MGVTAPTITPGLLAEHNLTREEYDRILEILGREPNLVELGIFSAMWSEHCSYKSSRVFLRRSSRRRARASSRGRGRTPGVVDIGDGLAVAFKMESHNHPSFIEPYQGAATGVGGILRDIFTMGARPIAVLDSLLLRRARRAADAAPRGRRRARDRRLRQLHRHPDGRRRDDVPPRLRRQHPRQRHGRRHRPPRTGSSSARAEGAGNPVVYVGSKTGRDGIHGATMASEEFAGDEGEAEAPDGPGRRPVHREAPDGGVPRALRDGRRRRDPGHGRRGPDLLRRSRWRRAAASGCELDLSKVPVRETGMTPYEIMLSESQERMLLVARRGREREVLAVFRQVGASTPSRSARSPAGPRRPLLRRQDRRGPAGRAARRRGAPSTAAPGRSPSRSRRSWEASTSPASPTR